MFQQCTIRCSVFTSVLFNFGYLHNLEKNFYYSLLTKRKLTEENYYSIRNMDDSNDTDSSDNFGQFAYKFFFS